MGFWIIAGLAAFILGLSKGGMPAMAILAVPLLSLYMDPILAAGLLLPLYMIADCYAVYLFRKAFSRRNLMILLPSSVFGIIGGYFAVSTVPTNAIKLLLAFIGFAYLANAIFKRLRKREGPPRPADVPRGVVFGALAGLTSYIAHAGGPPYQAYVLPQKLEKMAYLGTTTIFFTCVNIMKMPAFVLAGQLTWETLMQVLWLVPLALGGAWSGAQISRWLPQKVFFAFVEIALGLVSFKLLSDVLLS